MKSSELINEVKLITQENIQILHKQFIELNAQQRSWKKDKNVWNMNEVLMHLIEYAKYYHQTFLHRINKTKFRQSREVFTSSPLGKAAWKSMKLGTLKNIKRKIKSPKQYNPLVGDITTNKFALDLFIEKQEELLQIIDLAAEVDLKRVRIPISISKIVRLRLGDALLFVCYHNQRHMQQILNLINHPEFPKK
jgi:uncharacterized damage-inducible protein DinB